MIGARSDGIEGREAQEYEGYTNIWFGIDALFCANQYNPPCIG